MLDRMDTLLRGSRFLPEALLVRLVRQAPLEPLVPPALWACKGLLVRQALQEMMASVLLGPKARKVLLVRRATLVLPARPARVVPRARRGCPVQKATLVRRGRKVLQVQTATPVLKALKVTPALRVRVVHKAQKELRAT